MNIESVTLEQLNSLGKNTAAEALGIEFVELTSEYLTARMPVDNRTRQPFGVLHGGASVLLAETLGSVASYLTLEDKQKKLALGLEINANHLRSVKDGFVYGTATPVHLGRNTHVWEIRIKTENGKLVCISRLTVVIVNNPNAVNA